jgi:hypothetical protein
MFQNGKATKTVRFSKRYITIRYSYKTVHVTKQYTVTKRCVTKRYIIIMVQYSNGLVGH